MRDLTYSYHQVNYGNTEMWRVIAMVKDDSEIVSERSFKTEAECKKYIEGKTNG